MHCALKCRSRLADNRKIYDSEHVCIFNEEAYKWETQLRRKILKCKKAMW